MGPAFDPAPITSLAGFLDHVLARGFGGDICPYVRPDLLADRLPVLANILYFQFGYLLLAAAWWEPWASGSRIRRGSSWWAACFA